MTITDGCLTPLVGRGSAHALIEKFLLSEE